VEKRGAHANLDSTGFGPAPKWDGATRPTVILTTELVRRTHYGAGESQPGLITRDELLATANFFDHSVLTGPNRSLSVWRRRKKLVYDGAMIGSRTWGRDRGLTNENSLPFQSLGNKPDENAA